MQCIVKLSNRLTTSPSALSHTSFTVFILLLTIQTDAVVVLHRTRNMAASLEIQPSAPSIPSKHHMPAVQSCPSCGTTFQKGASEAEIAQRRVTELEGQMELLKEKATAAGET